MEAVSLASIPAGPYINGFAALGFLVVFFIWAKLMTWVDKDAPRVHLPRTIMNAAMWGGLVAGVFVFLMIPLGLAIDLSIFAGILLVEMGVYLGLRHQKVGLGDLVDQVKGMFESEKGKTKKDAKVAAGQLVVVNKAGVPMPIPDPQMPERQQYDGAQHVLNDAIKKGAERIDLVLAGEGGKLMYQVDGFVYEGKGMDKANAGAAISYMKFVSGLDVNEKRKPQTGPFKIILNGNKREMQITAKGSSSGESMTIISEPKKRHGFKIDGLGLSPDQLAALKAVIADSSGIVLLTASPSHGLTAMEYAVVRGHDAFLQHILTIERNPEQEIEGVTQNAISPASTAQEEAKQVAWVVSQEPDVVLMASVEDSNSARDLAGFAENDKKRAYVGMKAGNTLDALKQWRKLVGDDNLAIKSLKLVMAVRLLRRLCESCKVGYTPDPNLLRKLNMDPGKVKQLFQARTTPQLDSKGNPVPCQMCNDLGFKGRIGIYELLVVDDNMRQLLLNNASENEIKKAFRQQKGRYLQEIALELVENGETSVNEVQRVLRSPGDNPPGAAPAPVSPVKRR
jgi:type IV pilus assembly protein PilB